MTRVTNLPPYTCAKHVSSFLLDVLELGGNITHQCAICAIEAGDPLVEINVVRALHRRKSELGAERKDTGT